MKKILVFPLLLFVSVWPAFGQGGAPGSINAVIEKVEVTGISEQTLSADLRDALQKLVGQRYDVAVAEQFANRIEGEVSNMIAAPRALAGTAAGRVRLAFVVARRSENGSEPDSNVNSQYTVESVEVKGLLRTQYSGGLYDQMQQMVGQRVDNKLIEELRNRLVAEPEVRGRYFVSQKIERGSKPEHVKIVFDAEQTPWLFRATLGRVLGGNVNFGGGNIEFGNHVNDQDTVEAVEVTGLERSLINDGLNAELQGMVGKRIDKLEQDHLREKLKSELKDDYDIEMKVEPGTKPRQVRIEYAATRVPWIPYRTAKTVFAYHPKQGFSFVCCEDDFIGKYTTFNVSWDGDSLVERFKGFGFGVESTSLGTRRLGGKVEFSSFGQQWKPQTREAIAAATDIPGLYRSRVAVAPSMAFAFNKNVYLTAGFNFTELEMEPPVKDWNSAHAAVGSLHYDSKTLKRGKTTLEYTGAYEVRAGARNIGSDFAYTRHFAGADSSFSVGKNSLKLALRGGKITGNAPLFERFSLGDTQTLRGWNKYDIAPIGGNRVVHFSSEYSYSALGVFMDVGKVWDDGQPSTFRSSVGLTLFHVLSVGVPLRCSRQCGAMVSVRLQ